MINGVNAETMYGGLIDYWTTDDEDSKGVLISPHTYYSYLLYQQGKHLVCLTREGEHVFTMDKTW